MRLFRFMSVQILLACWVISGSGIPGSAAILDTGLLAMVPPRAEIVCGLMRGQPLGFAVITPANIADLTDFQSLTGVDPSRVIERVVLIATSLPAAPLAEHELLASGHFDWRHIIKSAAENGAGGGEYLGFPLLVLQPLERNRETVPDVRWMTLINERIIVFGTIATVQESLRRYVMQSTVDEPLRRNLARLRADDQTWSIVAPWTHRMEIVRRSLVALDPNLEHPVLGNAGLILGIHFGQHVEVEYENVPDQEFEKEQLGSSLPTPTTVPVAYIPRNKKNSAYHRIKVSRRRYDQWIAERATLPREVPPQADEPLADPKPTP